MFYSRTRWILLNVLSQTAGDVQGLVEIYFLQIVPLNPSLLEYCPLHSLHTLPTWFWFVFPDICKWNKWLLLIFPPCPWIYSRFLTSTVLCWALSNHSIQLLKISCLPSSYFDILTHKTSLCYSSWLKPQALWILNWAVDNQSRHFVGWDIGCINVTLHVLCGHVASK